MDYKVVGLQKESDSHPHVQEERAELYKCLDAGSTEVEILNFLESLVCLYKPLRILETGTYLGFGAMALAAGCSANGFGKVTTIEGLPDRVETAKQNVDKAGLTEWCQFVCNHSIKFLLAETEPFDFVFLDSDLVWRAREYALLRQRNLIKPGAPVLTHDTSFYRHLTLDDNRPMNTALDRLTAGKQGFVFPYSRGFRFWIH